MKLDVPYHHAFPDTVLLTETSLLDIVRCLHLRQEFSSVLFLLNTYGKKISYQNARIVGHLLYFRAYANLFGKRDTKKAVHYFPITRQLASTPIAATKKKLMHFATKVFKPY